MPIIRRRPLGPRPIRPIHPRQQAALERLQHAHQLIEEGAYKDAGRIFEELAQAAINRGIPRAPHLFLQAGNAFLRAGEHQHGMDCLRRGLHSMAKIGQIRRLPFASQRVLQGLHELGLDKEHAILEEEINQELARMGLSLTGAAETSRHVRLPVKCPYCGGTVHPQEVTWIDAQTATCDYCSSVIEASV